MGVIKQIIQGVKTCVTNFEWGRPKIWKNVAAPALALYKKLNFVAQC